MNLPPFAGLSVLLSALVLAGCSTVKPQIDSASTSQPGSGTTLSSPARPAASADISTGTADTGITLGAESLTAMRADATDSAARSAIAGAPDLRVVHFAFDSDALSSDSLGTLSGHARFLRNHPRTEVLLYGHTDERGTNEYNLALGERRGNAVRQYLKSQGVRSNQMEVISYGETKPVVYESTEEAWAQNRRVEIVYP